MQQYKVTQVDPSKFEAQIYNQEDLGLVTSYQIDEVFDPQTDYIEYFVYDYNSQLQSQQYEGEYRGLRIYDNNLAIDPAQDLVDLGRKQGSYYAVYSFLRNLVGSIDKQLYIVEISSDRTEIRLDTTALTSTELVQQASVLYDKINTPGYYFDFKLNLERNRLLVANNVQIDSADPNNPSILIKLYEPLPQDLGINTQLWVVEEVAEPLAYSLEGETTELQVTQATYLRGPNWAAANSSNTSTPTVAASYSDLVDTSNTLGTGSLKYNINSILQERGIEINIDYSDYSNFVHFSSARTRLENFYYKMQLLEQYQASSVQGSSGTYVSASQAVWQSKIDALITNFDGYEYYLYYTSGSTAWPKVTDSYPYTNASTTQAATWLQQQLAVAYSYDDSNKDYLGYAIPPYLKEDPNNQQLVLFVELLGQHFDVLWTYIRQMPNKYNTDSRLDVGPSKDLIAEILKDLGIKIYQNNFSDTDLYSALLGVTSEGSNLNIPGTTTTYPAPTGLEYVNTYVTASATSSIVPLDDANKEIYKRIYHNLPLLLKKKGTVEGLRHLVTAFGLPDTVLRVNQYAGQDRNNTDWDYWYNVFNYAFTTQGAGFVRVPWSTTTAGPAQTVALRIKPTGSLSSRNQMILTPQGVANQALVLEYTGSGTVTGSYLGAPMDPYREYATLKWISGSVSASVYQPFFNGDWWTIALTTDGARHTLYCKQKGGYEGSGYLRFDQSSSLVSTLSLLPSTTPSIAVAGSGSLSLAGKNYSAFSGSIQEVRYYLESLSGSVIDNLTLNPQSLQTNTTTGSLQNLIFRAPLGADLQIYSTQTTASSVHPSVTGSAVTQSFGSDSKYSLSGSFSFGANTETTYFQQPNAGIRIPVSDVVSTASPTIVGEVLSFDASIQRVPSISQSYTPATNYAEVGFSMQNQINDDIVQQLGNFNLGEYIGNPSDRTSNYTQLSALREYYFSKYAKNPNIHDFVRVIKYLDNSLFKIIKDFTPAKTNIATGVIVKQHILERNRYTTPLADVSEQTISGTVATLSSGYDTGSRLYKVYGTPATDWTAVSQSWYGQAVTPQGVLNISRSDNQESITGDFQGSQISIYSGSLLTSASRQFLYPSTEEVTYRVITYTSQSVSENSFLDKRIVPGPGEMLVFYTTDIIDTTTVYSQPDRPANFTQ